MATSIPGVLLSSLMFDMKNSPGDTVGLLLGDTLRYSVSAISDTDCSATREEKRICVQEYVVADTVHSFTDKRGRVDFNKLDKLVDGRLKSIVGWYRYRCNSTHQLSLMERTVHRHLMRGLPISSERDLLFGLFTEQTPDDPGLHTLEHSFSRWAGSSPELVHVSIVNLKSTSAMPYRLSPIAPIPSFVGTYHDLFDQRRYGLLSETGEATHSLAMEKLFEGLQQKFNPLKSQLRKSFNTIQDLEEEISCLEDKLNELKTTPPSAPTVAKSSGNNDGSDNSDVPPLINFNDEDCSVETSLHGNIPNGGVSSNPLIPMPTTVAVVDDEDTISV